MLRVWTLFALVATTPLLTAPTCNNSNSDSQLPEGLGQFRNGCPPGNFCVTCDDAARRTNCRPAGLSSCPAGLELCLSDCRELVNATTLACGSPPCRDLSTDYGHCGACGNRCDSGEVCFGGQCQVTCGEPLSLCDGTCKDLNSDQSHCGACGQSCGPREDCVLGRCQCGGAFDLCDNECVELSNDERHCGACGNSCGAGMLCIDGRCELSCPSGLEPCDATCVDVSQDENHCGVCGNVCRGGERCELGYCRPSCEPSKDWCGASGCVDLMTSQQNCGACGNVCGGGEVCDGLGRCRLSCAPGADICDEQCVWLDRDRLHCGACGAWCDEDEFCSFEQCVTSCPIDTPFCEGTCRDTTRDPDHCGGCGQPCDRNQNEVCESSVCCVPTQWYADSDGDGFGDPTRPRGYTCAPPANAAGNDSDCDDGDANSTTARSYYADCDRDGSAAATAEVRVGCEPPATGSTACCNAEWLNDLPPPFACEPSWTTTSPDEGVDCEDFSGLVGPSASEICNTIDDDCDGSVDEGTAPRWYPDCDGDTFAEELGEPERTTSCSEPPSMPPTSCSRVRDGATGWTTRDTSNLDCDDTHPFVHPGAYELCDERDNDCDGRIDEGCF